MKIKFICCILITMLSLTSCSGVFVGPQGLMKPPKVVGELSGVEEALYTAVGKEIIFIYPGSGEFRSSCIMKDIDGNGTKEALVLYALKSNIAAIHINLIRKIDGVWKSTYDMEISGTGVDSVAFADLFGDNSLEILLGSNMFNTREKQLSVYSVTDNILMLKMQENYTDYYVCNLTSDEKPQIMILNINTVTKSQTMIDNNLIMKTASARLISLNDEKQNKVTLGSIELDSNITGFAGAKSAKINDEFDGLYIDAHKGTSTMITELIYYNNKELINPFYNEIIGENDVTKRDLYINSRDIDNDGRIEIPQLYVVPGYENEPQNQKIYYTVWRRFDGTYFENVMTSVLNISDGYYLRLPDNWLGNVTITREVQQKLRIFSLWDFNKNSKGEELFKIQVFSDKAWKSGPHNGYDEIISKNGFVYAVNIINDSAEYSLSYEYILKNFHFL